MFHGVLALLERSLRVDARAWQVHAVRLGLIVGVYLSLGILYTLAGRFGAPGLSFFRTSIWLNVVFLTLLGVSYFSSTITEEKEEQTLGLMLMAGISPLGLLVGKLGGRLVQALLLLIVQYPFTLLAITLGGVSPSQISAAYVGLSAYLLMLAGLGLLCSTLLPRSRSAATWMVAILFVYGLVPYLCRSMSWSVARFVGGSSRDLARWLDFVASLSIFHQVESIMATGFGASPWSWQVGTNALLGLIGFALSWSFFSVATREPTTEATSRGTLTVGQTRMGRFFSPGRCWKTPFLWKDFYFVTGGWNWWLLRIGLYVGLVCVAMFLKGFWGMDTVTPIYQAFVLLALIWEWSLLVARMIQDEVRGQHIAALVMSPNPVWVIFYSKLSAVLSATIPGLVCLCVACLVDMRNVRDFFRYEGAAVICLLLLVPHLSAVFALFVRWGAVPLGLGAMIGVYWMIVAYFVIVRPNPHETNTIIALIMLAINGICHVIVLRCLPRIAARG